MCRDTVNNESGDSGSHVCQNKEMRISKRRLCKGMDYTVSSMIPVNLFNGINDGADILFAHSANRLLGVHLERYKIKAYRFSCPFRCLVSLSLASESSADSAGRLRR